MAKRRLAVIALALCLCICLLSCPAYAVSTADAQEMIDPEKACRLSIAYVCDGTAFAQLPVKLYKIADVSEDFQYSLTSPFAASGIDPNGVRTSGEWNVIRSTLESHIIANSITEDYSAFTDENGRAAFAALSPGIYLAVPELGISGDMQCVFDSALIALPGLGTDGLWQYQLAVTAKGSLLPPITPDEELSYKIIKLWKGDSGLKRPTQVEVEIFRNGESVDRVILSEETNWSYSWSAKDDGARWTVVERNVPAGYSATLEKVDTSFVLTNSYIPDSPPPTPGIPKTGDTSNLFLYTTMLYLSGMALVLLGVVLKKKRL